MIGNSDIKSANETVDINTIMPSRMEEYISIKRTTSNNEDFAGLVKQLDNELWNELNEDQAQYDQYNKVPDLPTVVLLYVNEWPVACGCFKKYDADTVEIKRMFVEKKYRRRGFSKIILEELEKWAIESGYSFALLETSIHFTAAKTLYKNAGYKLVPNYDQYAGLEESVCFKKDLLQLPASAFKNLSGIEYFDFEEDFVEEGIRCIPMILRMKLDKAGIKLQLSEWAKMNTEEKVALALLPCESPADTRFFYEQTAALVKWYTGKGITELTLIENLPWENPQKVPEALQVKAMEFNHSITGAQWQALTNLQRFALIKLCKPGHENRNFPLALKEFGLMK